MAAFASPFVSAPAFGASTFGAPAFGAPAYTSEVYPALAGYNVAQTVTPAAFVQPAVVPTISAVEVDRTIAIPTVQYAQGPAVAPGYPVNLREGDFYNPAANNVFDRLVGTKAGRGGAYQKKPGLLSRIGKKNQAGAVAPGVAPGVAPVAAAPVAAPIAAAPVAPPLVAPGGAPIVVPPSGYATQAGPSPYGFGPVAQYGPQGIPTQFAGGIGGPFAGPFGPAAVPVGAAPVAPIAGAPVQQVNAKGKPVKGKKGVVAPLPTLAQAEALDVASTKLAPTAWVGPPQPAGPPLVSTYPAAFGVPAYDVPAFGAPAFGAPAVYDVPTFGAPAYSGYAF